MSTQNSAEAKSFWTRVSHGRPITLCHESKLNENFQIQNLELTEATWKEDKPSSEEKSRQEPQEHLPEAVQAINKEVTKDAADGKYRFLEQLQPYPIAEKTNLSLAASFAGRLLEDSNESYFVWKTKWNIPPITVKATSHNPDGHKIVEGLHLDIYLVESSSHEEEPDRFNVLFDGIRGYTRKIIASGGCEFKNLKINRKGESLLYRFLLLPFLFDQETPRNRRYFDCFLSEEIAVYTEGEIIQIDKLENLEQYFELFDAQSFEKPLKPKIEKAQTELKTFQNYIFKKAVKVKNIVYLAFKFPEVIKLYGSAKIFRDDATGKVHQNASQLILQHSEDMQLGSAPIANYLHPEAKLVMHIKCPSRSLKVMICKDFTSLLSIIVGEQFQCPETLVPFGDVKLLKDSYQEYAQRLASERRPERKRNSESLDEDQSEEFEGDSSDSEHYDECNSESYSEITKKNAEARNLRNRKDNESQKKTVKSTMGMNSVSPKYPMRKRGRRPQNTKEEESSFDENEEDDSIVGRGRKPRIAVLADMKKKKDKLKAKNEEKTKEQAKPWNQAPASMIPMVPNGGAPSFGSGMIPVLPYGPQPTAAKPGWAPEKKGQPPGYFMMMAPPGSDSAKDKNDSTAKGQASSKPEMPGMPMQMNPFMGMMSGMQGMGMPSMAGMSGIPGMPGMMMPGMPGMPGMQGMQGMPSFSGVQIAQPGTDLYKMFTQQGIKPPPEHGSNNQQHSSEDQHKDSKKAGEWQMPMGAMSGMPSFAAMQGMAGMQGLQGMTGPNGMPGMISMAPGFQGMMLNQGGQGSQGGHSGMGGMPYLIMPSHAQNQQRTGTDTNTKSEKESQDKKNPSKPGQSTGAGVGQPYMTMPNFEISPGMLQQMAAAGMQPNFVQMGGGGQPGNLMQVMMPSQQASQQGQGQQGMMFPFSSSMMGGMSSPYGMMAGQSPFMMGGGMPPMMMAMPQQGKMNDQSKAAEESKGKDGKSTTAADKAASSSANSANPNNQSRMSGAMSGSFFVPPGGIPGMPGMSGMQGMPFVPGMQGMVGGQQGQMPFMMMDPRMMQMSGMQQPSGSSADPSQTMQNMQQNMQLMQSITSNQLGQIGMAQYMPQGMMGGMPMSGFPYGAQPNPSQRNNASSEKKKEDDKK